jgi:hypothetical protein
MKEHTLAEFLHEDNEQLRLPLFYFLTEGKTKSKNYFLKGEHKILLKKHNAKGMPMRFYKPISKFPL